MASVPLIYGLTQRKPWVEESQLIFWAWISLFEVARNRCCCAEPADCWFIFGKDFKCPNLNVIGNRNGKEFECLCLVQIVLLSINSTISHCMLMKLKFMQNIVSILLNSIIIVRIAQLHRKVRCIIRVNQFFLL